jgi:hypothetical protein
MINLFVTKTGFNNLKNGKRRCFTIQTKFLPDHFNVIDKKTKQTVARIDTDNISLYTLYEVDRMPSPFFYDFEEGLDYETYKDIIDLKKELRVQKIKSKVIGVRWDVWAALNYVCLIKKVDLL